MDAMIKTALVAGWVLCAADELIPAPFSGLGAISQVGALGVLAWAVWALLGEIRRLRDRHDAVIDQLCARWDQWEQHRHADSEKLDVTLREVIAHCASQRNR